MLTSEFVDCFASSESDRGRCNLVQHHVELQDKRPIKIRPYRQPHLLKQSLEEEAINSMLDSGVIHHSKSSWISPFFLVRKKDGRYWFVVNYNKLYNKIISDCFPIPQIDNIVDELHGSKYFTTLDLAAGYWQIEPGESSKQYTMFQTGNSPFEFNVLPFGLKNAPATFQRLLQTLFKDLGILPYIDDLVIASKTFGDHIQTIHNVFVETAFCQLETEPIEMQICRIFYRFI